MTLNILWWVAFFVFGLALQQALPGTDVLVAGLFLALQERRPFQLGVIWLMTRLQFIPLDTTQLLDESILQALLTPFVWQCSMMARRWVVPNENNTA